MSNHRSRDRLTVLPARVLIMMIRGYRAALSPLFPPTCRFTPSCSEYAMDALATHGLLAGSWMTLRRVGRCHPFHPGGNDPVPGRRDATG